MHRFLFSRKGFYVAPLESTKNKRLGLKALLLVCMFPVFLGAGFGGIFFNYFMARDNAQKRIDDHIFRRRMDLGYISLLPALNVTFDNIELGLENEAEFFRKQAADYTAAYLKRMSPPFEHILRVVLLNGDELFRIENGQVAAPLQVSVSSVLITSLKALEPDKQPTLPTFFTACYSRQKNSRYPADLPWRNPGADRRHCV